MKGYPGPETRLKENKYVSRKSCLGFMIQIGQIAPDFKLVDTEKNEVTLENFKGKSLKHYLF